MSHSFTKILVHSVWSTKDRSPLIHTSIEKNLYKFMHSEFVKLNCPAKIINGMPDHVHTLFLLNPQIPLADVIKQVKGASAYFINHSDLIRDKFSWQTGYAAFAVSQSATDKVFLYIEHQKEHHQKKTFEKEYEEFLMLTEFK